MIAKFSGVPGGNFATLLTFIHSEENRVKVPNEGQGGHLMIVRIKAVSPDNQCGGTWYGLTLEILEWVPKEKGLGQDHVDPKYLLKVYEIIGQNRLTECVESEQ